MADQESPQPDSPGELQSAVAGIMGLINKTRNESSTCCEDTIDVCDDDEIIWPLDLLTDEFLPEYFLEVSLSDEILPTRDKLVFTYQTLSRDKTQLAALNQQYQFTLMEYFRRKTPAIEVKELPLSQRAKDELESKYHRYLDAWLELGHKLKVEEQHFANVIADLKFKVHTNVAASDLNYELFMKHKLEVMKTAVHSQTGQKMTAVQVEGLLAKERQKFEELKKQRMTNLFLQSKVKKKELQVTSKEDLSGGHKLYDFEQLKIENQAYNDKVEERNEELAKFQRKILNTIHMTAHIKEKEHFLVGENEELRKLLQELDVEVSKKREVLGRIKHTKDRNREEQRQLNQRSGLVGRKTLLQDFRFKQETGRQLHDRLNHLQMANTELKMTYEELRDDAEEWASLARGTQTHTATSNRGQQCGRKK